MEVCAEAKRVMMQALSKMYSSRNQRGGIPLHRSLLLSLVMRAARDAYHSAQVPNHGPDPSGQTDSPVTAAHHTQTEELMDTAEAPEPPCALQSGERTLKQDSTADKENCNTTDHHTQSRKRRGKGDADPDFLPCKRRDWIQRSSGGFCMNPQRGVTPGTAPGRRTLFQLHTSPGL